MPTSLIILMFRNEIWIHLSYFNNFTTTAGDCSFYQNLEESFEIYNNILFQIHFQRYIRMITQIFAFNNDCHNYVSPYKGVGFLSVFFLSVRHKNCGRNSTDLLVVYNRNFQNCHLHCYVLMYSNAIFYVELNQKLSCTVAMKNKEFSLF
jgi:hypothetical protein